MPKRKVKDNETMLINGMFDFFMVDQQGNYLNRTIEKVVTCSWDPEIKHKIYTLVIKIRKSSEMEAYRKQAQELKKVFDETQEKKKKEERRPPLVNNIEGYRELMELDSGLIIEKVKVNSEKLPKEMDVDIMLKTDWFIDYS